MDDVVIKQAIVIIGESQLAFTVGYPMNRDAGSWTNKGDKLPTVHEIDIDDNCLIVVFTDGSRDEYYNLPFLIRNTEKAMQI